MLISLFTMIFDDDDLVRRVEDKNDLFDVEDALEIVEIMVHEILYSMFFEDPEEKLYCVIVVDVPDIEKIEFFVSLEELFYNKHIGKFIDKRKIINDIIVKFVTELEKVDWKII